MREMALFLAFSFLFMDFRPALFHWSTRTRQSVSTSTVGTLILLHVWLLTSMEALEINATKRGTRHKHIIYITMNQKQNTFCMNSPPASIIFIHQLFHCPLQFHTYENGDDITAINAAMILPRKHKSQLSIGILPPQVLSIRTTWLGSGEGSVDGAWLRSGTMTVSLALLGA